MRIKEEQRQTEEQHQTDATYTPDCAQQQLQMATDPKDLHDPRQNAKWPSI